ncbi:MAG TPA: hypothetical protein VJ860_14510 [Polyangia bacterium]|jgi:hypothetical protein|nr:hypothetical protein [Polyangia bacterium]
MRLAAILLFACGGLAGCGPSLLDQLTNGGGCSADDTVGVRGRCPNEQLACEIGWFDRDGISANGCESMLQPSSEYSLFALDTGATIWMTINEYEFGNDSAGGWVAIAGPACTALPATPCRYDLLAFQIGIRSFRFDGLQWTDGLLELPKPLPVVDNGQGLIIPPGSTFVASFVIEGHKRVVSQGTGVEGANVQSNGTSLTLTTGGDLRLPLGGYVVEKMSMQIPGQLVALP